MLAASIKISSKHRYSSYCFYEDIHDVRHALSLFKYSFSDNALVPVPINAILVSSVPFPTLAFITVQ